MRLLRLPLLVVLFALVLQAPSYGQGSPDDRAKLAFAHFFQGQIATAIRELTDLAGTASSGREWATRTSELLEVCSQARDWECVDRIAEKLVPLFATQPEARAMYPQFILSAAGRYRWIRNDAVFEKMLATGNIFNVATPATLPVISAELQLIAADIYNERNELERAELARSAAMMSFLLADHSQSYDMAKMIVRMLDGYLSANDLLGAHQLSLKVDRFMTSRVQRTSLLFAEYRALVAKMLSYGTDYRLAANALSEALDLYANLEITTGYRTQNVAELANMSAAAYLLAGSPDTAKAMLSRHPLFAKKAEIVRRGEFNDLMEFFFGVTDVFISDASGAVPDAGWLPLFQKGLDWPTSAIGSIDLTSYKDFSIAILVRQTGDAQLSHNHLMRAALGRLQNYEQVSSKNFESFFVPGLVDKIVVMAALTSATTVGDPASQELMLRGADFLVRGLRHSSVDASALLNSQSDPITRKSAHSLLLLLRQKRNWELDHIGLALTNSIPKDGRGKLISEYSEAVALLAKLKKRFLAHGRSLQRHAMPSITDIQRHLRPGENFISYYPIAGSIGKICVSATRVTYAVSYEVAGLLEAAKRLAGSIGILPTSTTEAEQFPFDDSARVFDLFFGGIETCVKTGSSLIVAQPVELSTIPLASLVRAVPRVDENGARLSSAGWLIKDVDIATIISAQHFIATRTHKKGAPTRRAYLGLGDPKIASANAPVANEARVSELVLRSSAADFVPLPETAAEIKAAAGILGAGSGDILVAEAATEEQFRSRFLEEYDILHFATHGVLAGELDGIAESALLLSPGSVGDSLNDGLLTSSEISRLSLGAQLVILSACNTANYDKGQGNLNIQDLQAAFSVAGVPTLIGSLWPVDSLSTQAIITSTLAAWKKDSIATAPQALARAMREHLRSAEGASRHPAYWAAFVVVGAGTRQRSTASTLALTFERMTEFSSGGEILDAKQLDGDLILSLYAEWDGHKMNGIITRRAGDGRERWRVASRAVGAGKVYVHDGIVYAAGYVTEADSFPILRAIDGNGRLVWERRYEQYRGYSFSDLTWDRGQLAIVAYPTSSVIQSPQRAFLLRMSAKGEVVAQIEIPSDVGGPTLGENAVLLAAGERLIVATNSGGSYRFSEEKRNVFGLPVPCNFGGFATFFEATAGKIERLDAISNFRVSALAQIGGRLIASGTTRDDCSIHGVASLYAIASRSTLLWSDPDLFRTSARQVVSGGKGFQLIVQHDRKVGLEHSQKVLDDGSKRWGEDAESLRESSIVTFGSDGRVSDRAYFSGGLSTFLSRGLMLDGRDTYFGTLGGVPGQLRMGSGGRKASGQERGMRRARNAQVEHNDWKSEVFRVH